MNARFEALVASVIRHILEDPHALQQAMEAEIKQALVTTLARQMGTLSPRMFLTTMAPVICREPNVFMQAAAAVCQVEKLNGRLTVVLKENKEKADKVGWLSCCGHTLSGRKCSVNFSAGFLRGSVHLRCC